MTRLRRAEPADVPALIEITREGFETYRAFAPPGWRAPELREEDVVAIDDVATWLVADDEGGRPVGHALLVPAERSREPVHDPALGHLMLLFVRRSHWGSGVATALHAAIVEEAPRRGFSALRLFTPAGQARARRFYEREGWREAGLRHDAALGFRIVEYRRGCPTPS